MSSSINVMPFLDTNILLYRISQDPAETTKKSITAHLLDAPDVHLSVQVLQEFYAQATRQVVNPFA